MHMKSRGTILKWVRAVLSDELSWHLRRDVNVQSDKSWSYLEEGHSR